jgi:hypothetical protein
MGLKPHQKKINQNETQGRPPLSLARRKKRAEAPSRFLAYLAGDLHGGGGERAKAAKGRRRNPAAGKRPQQEAKQKKGERV